MNPLVWTWPFGYSCLEGGSSRWLFAAIAVRIRWAERFARSAAHRWRPRPLRDRRRAGMRPLRDRHRGAMRLTLHLRPGRVRRNRRHRHCAGIETTEKAGNKLHARRIHQQHALAGQPGSLKRHRDLARPAVEFRERIVVCRSVRLAFLQKRVQRAFPELRTAGNQKFGYAIEWFRFRWKQKTDLSERLAGGEDTPLVV